MRKPIPDGIYYAIVCYSNYRIDGIMSVRDGFTFLKIEINKDKAFYVDVTGYNTLEKIYEVESPLFNNQTLDYRHLFKSKNGFIKTIFEEVVR